MTSQELLETPPSILIVRRVNSDCLLINNEFRKNIYSLRQTELKEFTKSGICLIKILIFDHKKKKSSLRKYKFKKPFKVFCFVSVWD